MSRYDDAERHFEDALEMNTRMGAPPRVARTQYEYAATLVKRDAHSDRTEVRRLIAEALATAGHIGMRAIEARSRDLLAQMGAAP